MGQKLIDWSVYFSCEGDGWKADLIGNEAQLIVTQAFSSRKRPRSHKAASNEYQFPFK